MKKTVDQDKRARVMQRSMRLGHCICNPKLPCPCPLFREKDVCRCSGERLDPPTQRVRLTRLVERAGCASKIDQAALKRVLAGLPSSDDPRVLVGVPAGDDAGVFRLGNGSALVQTVDVFTPSVDDPYSFGQIAAANSVSDVYAMGGKPLTALSIIGFPIGEVPDEVMREILRGGIDTMAEAGVAIIGGHSINDREIKAGFAVTGLIDPARIMTNAGARPGDVLILTKPLGTGIIAFAAQIDRAPSGSMEAATGSMIRLNKTASERMIEFGAHACTDITGFGLMGHLGGMAAASGVDVEIVWDDLPLLLGVTECVAAGILPGSVERNRESSGGRVVAEEGIEPAMLDVCFDAQTSGGLLIAVPKENAAALLRRLQNDGMVDASIIGSVVAPGQGRVMVRGKGTRPISARTLADPMPATATAEAQRSEECGMETKANEAGCCAEGHGVTAAATGGASGVSDIQRKFQDFLKAANAPGALDAHAKQGIALALSVLAKCEPCTRIHIRKARDMGFSQEQIDEAAWMAIAFGGSPIMMFYNELRSSS